MNFWVLLGLGGGTALGLSLIFRRWLAPLGLLDLPGGRKRHLHPVPTTAGPALIMTLILGQIVGWLGLPLSLAEWGLLGLMGGIGLLDDIRGLPAWWKALAGGLLAVGMTLMTFLDLQEMGGVVRIFGISIRETWWILAVLAMVLFWAVPQAQNLIDGANGVAVGYSIVVVLVLGFGGAWYPFLLGALVGCLTLNWPRARHFLGDCGALFLGLLIATLARKTLGGAHSEALLWVFAYPAVDLVLVVAVRAFTKKPFACGDRNHLHHWWQSLLGESSPWVAPVILVPAGLAAFGAVLPVEWMAIPALSATFLVGQAVTFGFRAVRSELAYRGAVPRTSSGPLRPQEKER